MSKKKEIYIAFASVYLLALVTMIVTLSLKLFYASLFISISILLNSIIPFSFLNNDNSDLKKTSKIYLFSFLRLFIMILATIIPCLLYFFIPFIEKEVNVGFLFFSPIFSLIQYIIIRVFAILSLKNETNTINK